MRPQWGRGRKVCSWLQSLSWGVFPWKVRRSERSLWSWCWTAAAGRIYCYCPSLLLLIVGEPLLTRAAVELGSFQYPTTLGGTLPICLNASGETRDPEPWHLSKGSIFWLFAGAWLPLLRGFFCVTLQLNTPCPPRPAAPATASGFLLHFACHPGSARLCCSSPLLRSYCTSAACHLEWH